MKSTQMEKTAAKHEMTLAINVGHWHYAFRNHSALFECAHCKKQQRRNTNFLGNRFELQCDGLKFHRVPRRRKEAWEFPSTEKKNDPNVNFGMYEADRVAKAKAQPQLPSVTDSGTAPRIIKAYPHQYSCGGYWIGETFTDGTIKCLSGKRTVLSRDQVIQRLGDNAVFSA